MSLLDIFKTKPKRTEQAGEEQFKDTYILALVHRLRTPLNGARWALDAAIKGETNQDNKELLNGSYNKIIDSINTVNEILKVAEINSAEGDLKIRQEKINLCTVVDGIVNNLNFLKEKKEITLAYDKKCDPTFILGDAEMLSIALTNIFDNAYRYSPKGNVTVTISKEGSVAKLSVKDTGIGIEREDLKHMFEKFYRGKNAQMIDPNESGVGLYSTKRIIEMHGGNISVDSEVNHGTTIEVRVPID
jgi:signal transduction histidine kinase